MENYSHAMEEFYGKINAQKLLDRAVAELDELEDYHSERAGDQMHRTAVIGKSLRAIVHGRNIYSQSSTPWRVCVRVNGQYTDYGTVYLYTKSDAEWLAADFNNITPPPNGRYFGLEA